MGEDAIDTFENLNVPDGHEQKQDMALWYLTLVPFSLLRTSRKSNGAVLRDIK